jgi:nucleotide-binding universal stress UspA family protein
MLAVRTILHPTDFSEFSDRAFRFAHALARDYGARLVVLHAYTPVAVIDYGAIGGEMALPEQERAMLEHKLHEVRIAGSEVPMEHLLVEGFAPSVILDAAKQVHADLIVIGTHGRTGLGRFLMGSVAEEVLRKATCPVLTVKLPSENLNAVKHGAAKTSGAAAAASV